MKTLTATNALRAGFAAMVVLLVYSALEANSLERAGSAEELDAYHDYIALDHATSALRRMVWSGSNHARDYFLSRDIERQERFEEQIGAARKQSEGPLLTLQGAAPERFRRLQIADSINGFLADLNALARSSAERQRYPKLLMNEMLGARRNLAEGALQDFLQEAQKDLRDAQLRAQARQADARKRLFTLLAIAVAVGVLIAGVSLQHAARWDRDRAQHYAAISEANERLEQLSARLLEIQEEERSRLSRELHDDIGQTLTALRMEITGALRSMSIDPPTRERLHRARSLTERTVQTVRDLSLMLRPSILDDLGLGSAIQWQIEEFRRRSQVRVEFDGENAGENLPENVKTCIFRIAQEALHNIEKYSGASVVTVSLRHDDGDRMVRLDVSDNGRGFELGRRGLPARGTGIMGMRERVAQLDGEFRIESTPGKGTRISVKVPAGTAAVTTA